MNAIIHSTSDPSQNSIATLPAEWQMLQQQAAALVGSGFLPQAVNTPQKAVAIMLLGKELGIAPWAALTSINVIQQKPTVSPQLMLALINRSGQLEDMTVQDDGSECAVVMKRVGRTPHAAAFSMNDAQTMGLIGKDNWKKQPAIMRQWRAVAACARVVFADVILGLYTPEEMGAEVIADEQGNMTVIDRPQPPTPITISKPEPESVPQLSHPATVSGAGLPTAVTRTAPDPLDWTEEDPNLYHCDVLKVVQSKTTMQYILCVKGSQSRIPLSSDQALNKSIGDTTLAALKPGDYPLIPSWSVYADKLPNGAWEVAKIETGMGEAEGVS